MPRIALSLLVFWPVAVALAPLLAWALAVWLAGRALRQPRVIGVAWNVLYGIDQLYNALLGGDPDTTISGRMGLAIEQGRCRLCRPVCWLLDRIDPGHCARFIERDEGEREVLPL